MPSHAALSCTGLVLSSPPSLIAHQNAFWFLAARCTCTCTATAPAPKPPARAFGFFLGGKRGLGLGGPGVLSANPPPPPPGRVFLPPSTPQRTGTGCYISGDGRPADPLIQEL
jgi:hypothetical protein